jgi:hypothetical protein
MPPRSSICDFWFWRCKQALLGATPLSISTVAVFFVATTTLLSQSVQHLSTTQPGGMPGLPVMGGIQQQTNGVRIFWDGPAGYYQVFQKSNSLSAPWLALGAATNLSRYAVITKIYSNAFFRVSGPAPKYAGVKVCVTCHSSICRYETNTPHANAFSSPAFKVAGGQTNSLCLPCHTVGYGLPTGFNLTNKNGIFSYATNLAGVQCENCHGPAANHANATDDPTVVPRVEIAATVCGGCHSASHTTYTNPPTFEEWTASEHAAVTPDALQVMNSSTNNIRSCGVCHSGSARLALIGGADPAVTLTKDYDVAITCAVCHDPHATNSNPVQLRNPIVSTNDFQLLGSDVASVAAFTNKYNASTNINLCAQCHNDRGAAWADTARAPHNSVQYNFLLGSVGEFPDGPAAFNPGSHAGLPSSAIHSISGTFYLTNQCVACHMQPDAAPAITQSHTFTAGYDVCLNCHDGQEAQAFLTPYLSNQVATVIFALNQWAALQAPPALLTNGVVPWEYTTPGGLTWQTNSSGWVTSWSLNNPVNFTGPNTAGQALIPDNIKKARFDLYLVLNDGSLGVHNPSFALGLLFSVEDFIIQELNN